MNITVYCGSNFGNQSIYEEFARDLGRFIAMHQHQLIYGGGNKGLMGVLANSVFNTGGQAIGIMPSFLINKEVANINLTEFIEVDTMSERKIKMIELGEAFVALPGGPGTLEEITEVISLIRLNLINKECYLMNIHGYYNHLEIFFDTMVKEGFMTVKERQKIHFVESIGELELLIEQH